MAEASVDHPRRVAAASAALFRDDAVLLVERAAGPAAGRWSLPGGHIEPGETAEAAARREVREETGVTAAALALLGVHDVDVPAHGDAAARHYRISVFCGPAPDQTPVAASDARSARFVEPGELLSLPLTEGALSLIRRAHAHARAMFVAER